jgi:signal transduction histidine kinase
MPNDTSSLADARADEELRALADQQGALRRIATLVAQGAEPERLFDAIAEEASRLLGINAISLMGYDPETTLFTEMARTHGPRAAMPLGAQWPARESPLGQLIVDTGRPARVEDWTVFESKIAERHVAEGFGPSIAAPIIVNGGVWGMIGAFAERDDVLPTGCEQRLGDFAHLMATALANIESREQLRDLAESQGALRRIATLVAQGAEPRAVFVAVAEEAARLLDVNAVTLARHDAELSTFTKIFGTHGERSPGADGTQWPVQDCPEGALVLETGRPARIDDWTVLPGPLAAKHVAEGFGQAVAAPIVVDGALWGVISAFGEADQIFPAGSELRLAGFTELIAAAISNVQARDALRGLAERQGAALRRVATLVAQQASPSAIFDAVAGEAGRALGVGRVVVLRCEHGRSVTVLGSIGNPALTADELYRSDAPGVVARVIDTGDRPARIDDWGEINGSVAEHARRQGFRSVVGAPITIDGSLWGVIVVVADEILPMDTETRLTDFTHLVASSISNVQAREELRALADEQGALRRVATLVAREAAEQTVFVAVAEEAARVLGVGAVSLMRWDPENSTFTKIYGTHGDRSAVPDGERVAVDDCPDGALVLSTGRPGRIDEWEFDGEAASRHAALGYGGAISAPILVDGTIWGVISSFAEVGEPFPRDAEARLAGFTELVASAISNVHARNNLIASRARIVTASDETRRRVERNLHDGIQQRLVALGLKVRAVRTKFAGTPEVEASLDEVTRDLENVLEEIRIFSHGLHPALLARSGLEPSVRELARRSPVPVELSMGASGRFPQQIETAVYYVISEALANSAKHANASVVTVTVGTGGSSLTATVADDGIGGAALGRGSGLTGLVDRVEALGGRLALDSPRGEGTRLTIELPLESGAP